MLVLLVGHTQFKNLDPLMAAHLTPPRLVFDTVNGWPRERWQQAGFSLERLGDRKNTLR